MRKSIKRILKRIFIFIVIASAIYLLVTNISFFSDLVLKDSPMLIIDTDAGYGLDDVYAVARIMKEPDARVTGLLSSQWRYADLYNDSTLYLSHDINFKLMRLFNRTHIPRYLGAALPMRYSGQSSSWNNPAAKFIADRAMETVSGEKLTVLCLGPSTNLATAIRMKPEAAARIRCYMMGPFYDPARRIWNKNEFNAQNDLEALDLLFNTKGLELHVMTATLAREMVFMRHEIMENLQADDEISRYLRERFNGLSVNTDSVSMGSVALVQAFLNPGMVSEKQVFTPPENLQRKIHVFTRMDVTKMKKDFWKAFGE